MPWKVIAMVRAVVPAFLALLPCVAFGQGNADEPIKTTLCQLVKTPDQFNGKMVQVRGVVLSSLEYGELKDGSCSAYLFPHDDGFPALGVRSGDYAFFKSLAQLRHPNRLKWKPIQPPLPVRGVEDDSHHQYVDVTETCKRTNEGRYVDLPLCEVTVTVVGRFDHLKYPGVAIRENLQEKPTAHYVVFGLIKSNASLNRLVWQSVSDVAAKPIDRSVYEKRK